MPRSAPTFLVALRAVLVIVFFVTLALFLTTRNVKKDDGEYLPLPSHSAPVAQPEKSRDEPKDRIPIRTLTPVPSSPPESIDTGIALNPERPAAIDFDSVPRSPSEGTLRKLPWWIPYVLAKPLGADPEKSAVPPRPVEQGCWAEPLVGEITLLERSSTYDDTVGIFIPPDVRVRLRNPRLPAMAAKIRKIREKHTTSFSGSSSRQIFLFPIVSYTKDKSACFVEDYIVQ